MSGREAINYAARARASLSLALVGFEPFYGLLRPGEDIAFQHTSILVRPRQTPRPALPPSGICGGAAGYCPRVRCAYCTTRFITIAGRTRQETIWGNRPLFTTGSRKPGQASARWRTFAFAGGRPSALAAVSNSFFRASIASRKATRSTSVLRHWANMPSPRISSSWT